METASDVSPIKAISYTIADPAPLQIGLRAVNRAKEGGGTGEVYLDPG